MKYQFYQTENGKIPFEIWFRNIRSTKGRSAIARALGKIAEGLLSDWKSVGGGIFEIRLHLETGYRIYFGRDGDKMIIILTGSDKSDQDKMIFLARSYWQDYLERTR